MCPLQEKLFLSLFFLHPQSQGGGWRRGVLICLKDRKKIRLWLRKIFSRPRHFLFFFFLHPFLPRNSTEKIGHHGHKDLENHYQLQHLSVPAQGAPGGSAGGTKATAHQDHYSPNSCYIMSVYYVTGISSLQPYCKECFLH